MQKKKVLQCQINIMQAAKIGGVNLLPPLPPITDIPNGEREQLEFPAPLIFQFYDWGSRKYNRIVILGLLVFAPLLLVKLILF